MLFRETCNKIDSVIFRAEENLRSLKLLSMIFLVGNTFQHKLYNFMWRTPNET